MSHFLKFYHVFLWFTPHKINFIKKGEMKMEEKKELFETYGFDLKQIAEDAKANGREDVAEVIENKIADFQKIYDFFASKHTANSETPLYQVDAEDLKNW